MPPFFIVDEPSTLLKCRNNRFLNDERYAMFALLIAASILGIMLFLSFVVLPITFSTLTKDVAGNFVRKIFPVYHIVLFVASQLAGVLAFTPHLKPIAFLCGLVFALHFVFLTPAINRASDAGNTKRFTTLHRLSVLVNVIVMALYAFALYADACFF